MGPIAAAIVFAARGTPVRVPPRAFVFAQAVVGCMIAGTMPLALLTEIGQAWPCALIASCAVLAWLLVRFAHVDPLTAYLATSPGGADTVAIIASSSPVDVPFVMAMQSARFVLVAFCGLALARWVARRVGAD